MSRPFMKDVARSVAAVHGLTLEDLCGPSLRAPICRARHHAMFEVRRTTARSFPVIGRFFGNRHHTTVLSAVRRHQEQFSTDACEVVS